MSTAISRVYTPEGFVIASDSRTTINRGEIIDGCTKIFHIDKLGARLAYGIGGVTNITSPDGATVFDFASETTYAVEHPPPHRSWWDYLTGLGKSLVAPLNEVRTKFGCGFLAPEETSIFMCGFFGKFPKCGRVEFKHGTAKTDVECTIEKLGNTQEIMLYGSVEVFKLLSNGSARLSRYVNPRRGETLTLSAGIERARNDVCAHYDPEALKIDRRCSEMGGPIHIATITPAHGFSWVPGYEPAPIGPVSQ